MYVESVNTSLQQHFYLKKKGGEDVHNGPISRVVMWK